MRLTSIDNESFFDFGRTSVNYGKYRDIYPKSMYDILKSNQIGRKGQKILDLGSGTAILPLNMADTGAEFVSSDISKKQIEIGKVIIKEKNIADCKMKMQ